MTAADAAAGGADPREISARFRWIATSIAFAIAAIDGFDVLAGAYTAPSIVREWALAPTQTGMFLSASLVGMGLGALFLAPVGDRFGRRPGILICLAILCIGMTGAATSPNLMTLIAWRVFTGIGIGGVLVNLNILMAELPAGPHRHLAVSIMAIGYPVGATLGGFASLGLIKTFGWMSVYLFGGMLALVMLPITAWLVPESLRFLETRSGPKALERLNRMRQRMALPRVDALPETIAARDVARIATGATTGIAVSIAYFVVMLTVYFVLSWTPRIVATMGLGANVGILASTLMNFGGCVGCLLYGLFAERLGARRFAACIMIGLFASVTLLGWWATTTISVLLAALAVGFCMHSSIASLYCIVPAAFPPSFRATGTGLAMSVGRVGAASGPYLAGVLIASGWSRPLLFFALSMPMALAAASLRWIGPWRVRTLPGQHLSREAAGMKADLSS